LCRELAQFVLSFSFNGTEMSAAARILCETGIDELPQLFDVLRGQLSIIGPPPSPCLKPRLNKVKPGMIQWAQIVATRNRPAGDDRQ
jgi:lipopolysaccharide/colanic/teichoic acid biosynthesis glycosyltransferase